MLSADKIEHSKKTKEDYCEEVSCDAKCHSLLQSVTEFQSYLEDPQQNVKNSLLAAVTVFHGGEMKLSGFL
jgi:hypothetical protein